MTMPSYTTKLWLTNLGPGSEVYSPADLEAYKNGTDNIGIRM